MKRVKLVMNKKANKWFIPSTSGKWLRIQMTQEQSVFTNGFQQTRTATGFAYFANEERANAFVQEASVNGMTMPGSIVYMDQLEPINTEAAEYGKQYPYPFRHNGVELSLEDRLMVQAKAVEAGLSLQQSGQPIYRRKFYTPDVNATSTILSPDNQDDINAFISTLLTAKAAPDPAKVARLTELRAIAKTGRNAAQKKELADLIDELEG